MVQRCSLYDLMRFAVLQCGTVWYDTLDGVGSGEEADSENNITCPNSFLNYKLFPCPVQIMYVNSHKVYIYIYIYIQKFISITMSLTSVVDEWILSVLLTSSDRRTH